MQNYTGNSAGLTPTTPVTISNPENLIDPISVETNNVAVNKLADFVKMLCNQVTTFFTKSQIIDGIIQRCTFSPAFAQVLAGNATKGRVNTGTGTEAVELSVGGGISYLEFAWDATHLRGPSGINTALIGMRFRTVGGIPLNITLSLERCRPSPNGRVVLLSATYTDTPAAGIVAFSDGANVPIPIGEDNHGLMLVARVTNTGGNFTAADFAAIGAWVTGVLI